MKQGIVSALVFLAAAALCQVLTQDIKATAPSSAELSSSFESVRQDFVANRLDGMPIAFTENVGQWDERVKFRANAGGTTLWFTTEGIYYQFVRLAAEENSLSDDARQRMPVSAPSSPKDIEQIVIKAAFVGTDPGLEIIGEGLMEHQCNYFIGNDPSKWYTNVSNYRAVTIRSMYEGIDLHYYCSADGKPAYQYSIAPEANADRIRFEYEGLEEVSLDETGNMIARTESGEIIGLLAPPSDDAGLAYGSLSSSSASRGTRAVELGYSTFLGHSSSESGLGIAVDASGCAYVTGATSSSSFPTDGYDESHNGSADVFVSKFSASGSSLIYSTFLGGSAIDSGQAIALDASGCAFVTGHTTSTNFPTTTGAYRTFNSGDNDAFVTKLSAAGDALVYSTYLGGADDEFAHGIAVDGSGCAYVTGRTLTSHTESPPFPLLNHYDDQYMDGFEDAFLTKFYANGQHLHYSTYLGGSVSETGFGVVVDASGCAYVTGYTGSSDFPTTEGAYDETCDGDCSYRDAFVTKFAAAGNSLIYSTFLGGSSSEEGHGIAIDASGYAYVTGFTGSSDFPTTEDAYDESYNGNTDAFVTKLSTSGDALVYSTFLGGSSSEYFYGHGHGDIAVDASGYAYVAGATQSSDFPVWNAPYEDYSSGIDAFVSRLSQDGSALIMSTFLGDSGDEQGRGIACGGADTVYVTGYTSSTSFPTTDGAYDESHNGGYDVFVTVLVEEWLDECGNVNRDGTIDVDDLVYLINYVFGSGPAPDPYDHGNVDCSEYGDIDVDDIVHMINYIFSNGYAPCDTTGDGEPDC